MNRTSSKILHGLLLATSGLVGSTVIASTAAMAGGGPTGGTVAVGSATIVNASPTQTVVNQSSKKALINWNSFSIPGGSSVKFNQPNSKSLTVNRVTGPNASTIDGALLANGNVWLINANGVLFGKGSQINVGALLATTSDLSDDDFKAGKYTFKPAANPDASIVNKGTITAGANGSVVLSAPHVSNEGLIQADLGTVVLGGAKAFTVDMTGDNLLRYQITAPVTNAPKDANDSVASALVSNSGTILANGGHVVMTARAARNVEDNAINNTGMVEATSVSSHNGVIDFDAGPDGTVNDSGTLNASGSAQGQTGGTVNVTGGTVNIADGAKIDASGNAGGGTIQIGGGLHGQGTLAHAQRTIIGAATISADATGKGNGGTVAVWSDDQTSFAGSISARGGAQGGNGGQVETSGHNLGVAVSAKVDTSAPLGLTGDWLLDPTDLVISSCGSGCCGSTCFVSSSAIAGSLATTDMIESATNTLTLDANSDITWNSTHSLTLLSGGAMTIGSSIQNAGSGNVTLVAGWDGTTTNFASLAPSSGAYGATGGDVTIGGESAAGDIFVGSAQGITAIAGSNVTISAFNGNATIGYGGAGGGNINVFAKNNISTFASGEGGGWASVGNGDGSTPGAVTGDIFLNAGGDTTFVEDDSAYIGNFAANGSTATGNVTIITNSGTLSGGYFVDDLGSGAGSGGNVFVGFTGANGTYSLDGLDNYNSANSFTWAAAANLTVTGNTQNSGSGSINIIAGWDGHTTSLTSLTNSGVYGNNYGSVTVDGASNVLGASIGSKSGKTTVLGYDVDLTGMTGGEGNAQIGYHNAGATGAIDVRATHDISVVAGDSGSECEECNQGTAYAQIGNGGAFATGSEGGNISVRAGGNITVSGGDNTFDYAQIGNGGDAGSANQGTAGDTGNITVTAGGWLTMQGGVDYAQIGNGGWGSNGSSGNISVTATGNISVLGGVNSPWGYAQIGNGGQDSLGTTSGDIAVTTNGTLSLVGGNNGMYAQIGNGGDEHSSSGSSSGNITVVAGNLTIAGASTAGGGNEGYAVIGNSALYNGSVSGSGIASGNISIKVGGTTKIQSSDSDADAWIGNGALNGTETGAVTLITGLFDDSADNNDDVSQFLLSDIVGGDVTLGVTNASSAYMIGGFSYTSANALTILSASNLTVTHSIQNSGTGNITLVAGWNPAVAPSAVFTTSGSYGVGGKTLTIGGSSASGSVAVGSKGGSTNILTGSLLVSANNGNAQLGYYGAGTGSINVYALGNVTVQTETNGTVALIGNGGFGATGAIKGDITIAAGGNVTVKADASSSIADIGVTGGEGSSQSGNITITSGGQVAAIAKNSNANAQIGNEQIGSSAPSQRGDASGDITVTAKSVLLSATGSNTGVTIGNGNGLLYNRNVSGNIVLNTGDLTLVSNATSSTGTLVRVGSRANGDASGNLTVNATGNVSLTASNYGNAIIGHGALGTASGNIAVNANGSIALSATGTNAQARIGDAGKNASGNIAVKAGGALSIVRSSASTGLIGGFAVNGTLAGDVIVTANSIAGIGDSIFADLAGGDFTLTSLGTKTINVDDTGTYNSSHNLVVNSGGDVVFGSSLQNAGSGNITFISAGDITIGGSGAGGGVAVGSKSGTTKIVADSLLLSAVNGYAQLGYHGSGTGAIVATIAGDVTLSGGGSTGYYAQIGDGGYNVTGSSRSPITLTAGGDIALNGGSGREAYAQIGNGGAESNSNASGYSETGFIAVTGDTVTLDAGDGAGSYAQIGHGGYKSGQSLHGTATLGGNITVNAATAIRLLGGGDEAYAQIGNGGDFVNSGAADGSGGTISGEIAVIVAAPNTGSNDPLTLTAGTGLDSYAQIGNGGQGENTPATGATVSFDISGNVTVADLTLTGSNTGANGYAQIGNGDISKTGTGNVSGNVGLGQGTHIDTIPGSAPGAGTGMGNATGFGTTGGTPISNGIDPGTQGSVASITQNPTGPTNFTITTIGQTPGYTQTPQFGTNGGSQGPTPLEQLADNSNSEGAATSDGVAHSVGQSLGDGKTIYVTSKTIIPGVLKQIVTLTPNNPHGVPPADVDYSSWGNEALWRW